MWASVVFWSFYKFKRNSIEKEAWNTSANTEDKREKIHVLSLAKECYDMKLDLLTNATVEDNAIRFVAERMKNNADIGKEEEAKEETDIQTFGQSNINSAMNTTTRNQVL